MSRILFLLLLLFPFISFTQNKDFNESIKRIGLKESKVMEIASTICDEYGPRLTGSAKLAKAQDWAVTELKSWGLSNVHKEEWGPFGRGWHLEHFEMHAHSPDYWPVIAYPKAWSPSTSGLVSGELIYLQANESAELEKYKGKLKGKIVMLDSIREISEWFDAPARRYNSDDLLKMANAPVPAPRPRRDWARAGGSFGTDLWKFLDSEQPVCIIDRNYKGDLGTVFVTGARPGGQEGKRAQDEGVRIIPQVTLSVEHYNRLLRLINRGQSPKVSFNIKARYESPNKGMDHNVVAEIEGADLKDEVVMFGAHFDSWHAGTGATDNGAGSAVMMEAARILNTYIKESGQKPRRTLRLALWSGEEQGLYGSINYVRKHFAETEPGGWIPKSLKPDHEKISAYYNLDNGTGKVRGIYAQGNEDVVPIFREWLDEFKDLGANTITLENTGGTDHLGFDGVGIPGFQFIQEPIAYSNRTHHSNMDNWDHLVAEDLKQAATVIASMVWQTAQRNEKLPRKPMNLDTPATDVKSKTE
ncbi:MAG: M20/M25/M40 family metallo-hydrolase [Saprospiraceae bacterium]|jgi:carboxypeptidase Q|nr:M20/M25/M40 family metallo-hydrolase [Saprospiraceae bacterium]